MADWMSNIAEDLTTVPLNQLAIPGSHDSGSFNMTTHLSPSAPAALRDIAWIPGFIDLFGTLLIALSTTQTMNIGQQLNAGIRHLDFRLSWWIGEPYFVHSVYGTKVGIALEQMATFLDKHPREVIILDLQQFHEFSAEEHTKFIASLNSTFGDKFLPPTDLNNVTLKNMWEQKKQIICIYGAKEGSTHPDFWSSEILLSPWPNKASPTETIKLLDEYMDQAQNVTDKFSVCQAVVTPDIASIIKNLVSDSSLKSMTKAFNKYLMPWLADSPNHWKHLPNVVIHDFVEMDDYVNNVLALNKLRSAKA